jgi:hypothetical protein
MKGKGVRSCLKHGAVVAFYGRENEFSGFHKKRKISWLAGQQLAFPPKKVLQCGVIELVLCLCLINAKTPD